MATASKGLKRVMKAANGLHESRQRLAREFGATDIVTERGDEGVAKIKELTGGLGAHSTVEAVGTQESMMQAIRSTRPGGHVCCVAQADKGIASSSPVTKLLLNSQTLLKNRTRPAVTLRLQQIPQFVQRLPNASLLT